MATFAVLIAVGTALLCLPIAWSPGQSISLIEALFTATSAVCVTGLVVVDTAGSWSIFGQTVIASLIVIGGLGIMMSALVIIAAVGRRITLTQRLIVRETLGGTALGNVVTVGRYVMLFAIGTQLIGFFLLVPRLAMDHSIPSALWHAVFHSASAFNNAGFTILPGSASLAPFQSDPYMLITTGILVLLGAASFPVINELLRRRQPNRWALDTRLVVLGTLGLWVIGILAVAAFELGNPKTLANMSTLDQLMNIIFEPLQRTSGFSTFDFAETRPSTDFVFLGLMFIGGASGSVAGGIKINTAMVLVVAALASMNGRARPEMFRKEIPYRQVTRALAILAVAILAVATIILALTVTESSKLLDGQFSMMDIVFESVSGFGTVGLSRGITPDLSDPGKIVLVLAMYLGRLGPLTFALGLALKEQRAVYRYGQESVRIG